MLQSFEQAWMVKTRVWRSPGPLPKQLGRLEKPTFLISNRRIKCVDFRAPVFNPHQRCGYSDSPFARKDTFLYCRVQKGVGEGCRQGAGTHKRKLTQWKRHFFVIEKYVEDVKQDEKSVPDLVESIIEAPGLVKEELQQKPWKLYNLDPKSLKSGFQLFGFRKSDGFPPEANASLLANKFWALLTQ